MQIYERVGGARDSHFDSRTKLHDTSVAVPLIKGGYDYIQSDILDQYLIGKCTGISIVQNANKALGKKFSDDFQYLCQKKFYDLDWDEGSSIFNALKVGKNIGFLPVEHWTYTTPEDSDNLTYQQYIAKLKSIPDAEIQRLITLCTDKLTGYAQLTIDSQSLAKGIIDSTSGILCRYTVGNEWWTAPNGQSSWATKDLEATGTIRPPKTPIDGHAIGGSKFDFSVVSNITHPNTWGTAWNDQNQGNCHIDHAIYKCTEAWIPYYNIVPPPLPAPYIFTQDIHYGDTSEDVRQLQKYLVGAGFPIPNAVTNYFGDQTRTALISFQDSCKIPITFWQRYFRVFAVAGPVTRVYMNMHPQQ